MAQTATPIVIVANGSPVTPVAKLGTPVTLVGGAYAVLEAGATFETDDGGSVTIDTIEDGQITGATYTAGE